MPYLSAAPTLPKGSAWGDWAYSGEAKANYVSVRLQARIAPGVGTEFFIQGDIQVLNNGVQWGQAVSYGARAVINTESSSEFVGTVTSDAWQTVGTVYYQNWAPQGTRISIVASFYTKVLSSEGSLYVPQGISLNLPIYLNVGGTVHQVEKAYLNVGGAIKECEVYLNAGGTVRQLK